MSVLDPTETCAACGRPIALGEWWISLDETRTVHEDCAALVAVAVAPGQLELPWERAA